MITVQCNNKSCKRTLKVKDEMAGRKVKCPGCSQVQALPLPDEEDDVAEVDEAEEDTRIRSTPQKSAKRKAVDKEDEEDEERPTKKRKGKKLACPFCGELTPALDEECRHCDEPLDDERLEEERDRLKKQRPMFQLLSLIGLPGLVMAGAGLMMENVLLQILLMVVGGILLWVGLTFAVLYKKFHFAWVLLGLLNLLGLIIIACLPDDKKRRLDRIEDMLDYR